MAFAIGSRIGDAHRVLDIRQGGMGVVYIAEDDEGRRCAIKTIHDAFGTDSRALERFRAESRTWINLGAHDHIVRAFSYQELDGVPLLFLEFIDGIELKDVLDLGRPVYLPQAIRWAREIAEAMEFVHTRPVDRHGRGVVHRDLKPGNVLIDRAGATKVTDFGLARVPESSFHLTMTGAFLGTPYYAAPEQIRDARAADRRADIYSFGVILYEMLAGERPFQGETIGALVHQVLDEDPRPPRNAPELLPALCDLTAACLEKDPDARPQAFREILDRLDAVRREVESRKGDEEAYRRCPECGLWMPASLATCLFDRRPGIPPAAAILGESSDTVNWASLATAAPPPRPAEAISAPRVDSGRAPAPVVRSVSPSAHSVRPGETFQIRAVIHHPGPDPVVCRIPFRLPAEGSFELCENQGEWRGEVAGTKEIIYRIRALETGRFASDPFTFEYVGRDGVPRSVTTELRLRIAVEVSFRIPLVGRDDEIARLKAAIDETRRGSGRLLVLRGAAGVGKSRLLAEIADTASDSGGQVLFGAASIGSHEPLKPFREMLLNRIAADLRTRDEDKMRRALERALPPRTSIEEESLRFITSILCGSPLAGAQDDPIRTYHWYQLFDAFASGGLLVVAVENLQWADHATLNLLVEIAARARDARAPILVCGACRTSAGGEDAGGTQVLERRAAQLAEASAFVDVRPLDPAGTRAIIDRVFPGHEFDLAHPWLADALHRASGGNPLFILEIFRELTSPTDPGRPPLIRGRLEAWNISSALGQEDLLATLPAHAEEMLGRRLEGLDPPEREFLELCALIGDEFDVSILDRLIEDEDALDRILDGLQGKGLIEPTSRTLERYRFAQPLLSAVVCGDVRERGPRRARRLHRRIAEAFEAIASREVPARLKIAHHWIEGAEPARGIPHLIAGLTWLMEHGLFRDARVQLAHWESASESATEIPEVRSAGFHLLRGRILVATGEYERALDAFRAAEREATERGDRHGWGRALMRIGEVLHRQGKPEEARVHFVRALEILGEIDDPRSLADAHTSFGVCCRAAGDVEQAEAHLAQALDLYRRCGDRRGESSTLINLANVHKTAGRHAEARACCLSALEIARELKNHLLEGTCHLSIGNSLLVQDEIEKALEEYGAVLEIYKRIGYKAGLGTILVNLAKAFAIRGDLGKAIHHAELSLRIAREVGRPSGEANSLVTLAELFTRIHRHDRAIEAAEAAGTIAASLGDAKGEAESLYIRGRCTAAGGDPSGARAFYERAAERGRAAGGGSLLAQIRLGEAELALREGSAEQALAIFREVRETTERLTLPALAAIATAGEGRCLAALGRIERAREALAAAVGRSADLPPTECERWAILFSHYEILTALGEDGAARALDEAHESLMRVASTLHDDDLRGAFLSEEICAAIVREARRG